MDFKSSKKKDPSRECFKIGVINQKGGVGKTTTAISVAAVLAEKNYKVLLIDMDPQGNTSSGLDIDKNDCDYSSYDCLLSDDVTTDECIVSSHYKNLWVIPATLDLSGAETELAQVIARETRLDEATEDVDEYFDYIIIDCPPSLGQLTVNALTCADSVLIPIQCEFFALEGLTKIVETVGLIKRRLNPDLAILGVLFTMFDKRTTLSKQVVQQVTEYFGDKVFKTKIPRSVRMAEAPGFGQAITEYEPRGKGTKAYRELSKEVISRRNKLQTKIGE